jgi:hypothetical protein
MMQYKKWIRNFWFSFPIQLFLLHFKKNQLILIYWYLMFATVGGGFMKLFGADSLFLAPEYLDTVNGVGAYMVGVSVGIFIMSWNITTFILFSKHIKFLATTNKPFVKYCLNNFIIPSVFLVFYLSRAAYFGRVKELFDWLQILELILGFLLGLLSNIILSFLYFFSADKNITKRIEPVLNMPHEVDLENIGKAKATTPSNLIKVKTYLTSIRKTAVVRDVKHYNKIYIETVFSRHHLASVILIILAFFFLIGISFFLDYRFFQIPAAASITLFFAILLSVFGALAYFLQNWSLPVTIAILLSLNFLYNRKIIDPTNKAYGLDYTNKKDRPVYDAATIRSLCTPEKIKADKEKMILLLNKWKQKQLTEKPVFYLINVSGGGSRSATFSMLILQKLDSLTKGNMMKQCFLISGASGGMLGAAYFRELYRQKNIGALHDLQNELYSDNIGKDLLNPIFSSLVARDILSPAQRFRWKGIAYLKDRAYAFEEKLNANTNGILNKSVGDYAAEESNASIPLMITSSIIIRDGRKMMISTQPISFMMQPDKMDTVSGTQDAIDFNAFFVKQNPFNLRFLTAIRMNASFPYVLPTVWLPTDPVIDVMDAGLRDNYGQDISMRFISNFEEWLTANTSKVVILSIRDRQVNNWVHPFESNSMLGSFTKPVTQLQYNLFKIQDYNQNDQFNSLKKEMGTHIEKIIFQYIPSNEENHAALSFHLTNREKKLIKEDLFTPTNQKSFERIQQLQVQQ